MRLLVVGAPSLPLSAPPQRVCTCTSEVGTTMSIIASTILFLSALSMATAQQKNVNLTHGSSLSPSGNSSLLSQSGRFAFGFFPFGEGYSISIWFEATPQKTVVWTANRNDPPLSRNANIVFTIDGSLVFQDLGGQQKSISNATKPAVLASMLDSGNFVLYDSNSTIIWQSFDYPTDTLLPFQLLRAGSQLVSSSSETNHSIGIFRIEMQTDGNIVLYPVGFPDITHYAYWASSTFVGNNATLTLDGNGRLYMLNSTGVVVENITNEGIPSDGKMYRATIDNDGIFRLYSHDLNGNGNWSIVWLQPGDACAPKGVCGINGYCSVNNIPQSFCTCPAGFVFINQEQMNLGCNRNFTAESCAFKNGDTKYAMQELQNTILDDSAYALLSSVTKDECKQACLEDCNCEAAFFQNQECRKQKLPLTFWRSAQVDGYSTATLVKFGIGMVPKESKKILRRDILIIGVACLAFAFALILLAFFAILILRYRIWAYKRLSYQAANEGLIEDVSLRAFTYSELEVATNGFVEQLGRGSFGTVFKGTLSNGQRTIAVKRLEKVMAEGEGEEEFRNEMRSIGRTHHKSLVRLLGYCHDGSNRLLVYEYMSNGTLADYLFKSQVKPNWEERIKIAMNIARGILYLHEECENQIIHCDINPNNILMDDNECAKIADFGLAKLLMPDHSRTLTGIRGTRGYVAPEWHKNLPITVKADVYSFGIVFFVIICCRRSIEIDAPEDEVVLVNWVYDCFKSNEVRKLVPEEVDAENLERMVNIGLWCIEEEPAARPSMKKVIQMLEGTVSIPIPPCARSSVEN